QALAAEGEAGRMRTVIGEYKQLARQIGYRGVMELAFDTDGDLSALKLLGNSARVTAVAQAFYAFVLTGRGDIREATFAIDRISDVDIQAAAFVALARRCVHLGDSLTAMPIVEALPQI